MGRSARPRRHRLSAAPRWSAPSVALAVATASTLALTAGPGAAAAGHAPGPVPLSPSPAAAAAPLPGPAVLHEPPPRAPQLENAPGSPWHASPLLVSGAGAYRDGEFLYQDYLFDDRGAGATYAYPTDPRYAGDAADLVEFRVKPSQDGLVVRLTYNAMTDPSLVATTIALGTSARPRPLPFDAGAREPAQVFVTAHGSTAVATDAATGATVPGVRPAATADLTRRQVTIRIPRAVFDTTGRTAVRIASASGLWDTAAGRYLRPVPGAPTSVRPGDGGTAGGALFNAAFRYAESGQWRDTAQAAALASGDLSAFFTLVDLGKLRQAVDDDMAGQPGGIPVTGLTSRIFASHFEDAQGRAAGPFGYCHQPCARVADYAGRLQPYSVYLPDKPAPRHGYGLVLNLHYCGGSYNDGPPDAAELADQGGGSLVITPEGRGQCLWYWSESGADVFEAWADAARHFPLDPGRTSVSGWSMGGYGAYKLLAQFPDLFARALTDIGCVGAETGWPGEPAPPVSGPAAEILPLVPSYRDVPLLSANGDADPVCVTSSQQQVLARLTALGYRFDWRWYDGGHGAFHPTPAEAAAFLGAGRVDPDPPHVTYVLDAAMNEPRWGLTTDHVYWLSGLRLRDPGGEPATHPATDPATGLVTDPATDPAGGRGTVDVFSHGFGLADSRPGTVAPTAGTSGDHAYTGTVETWDPARHVPPADRLDVSLTNISDVTIDVARARVDCHATLNVTSDGPAVIRLAGCGRTVSVRPAQPARQAQPSQPRHRTTPAHPHI